MNGIITDKPGEGLARVQCQILKQCSIDNCTNCIYQFCANRMLSMVYSCVSGGTFFCRVCNPKVEIIFQFFYEKEAKGKGQLYSEITN